MVNTNTTIGNIKTTVLVINGDQEEEIRGRTSGQLLGATRSMLMVGEIMCLSHTTGALTQIPKVEALEWVIAGQGVVHRGMLTLGCRGIQDIKSARGIFHDCGCDTTLLKLLVLIINLWKFLLKVVTIPQINIDLKF